MKKTVHRLLTLLLAIGILFTSLPMSTDIFNVTASALSEDFTYIPKSMEEILSEGEARSYYFPKGYTPGGVDCAQEIVSVTGLSEDTVVSIGGKKTVYGTNRTYGKGTPEYIAAELIGTEKIQHTFHSADYIHIYVHSGSAKLYINYANTYRPVDNSSAKEEENENVNKPEAPENTITKGYSFGEDTYSFYNFSDDDSEIGHCFGMAITSSGYYLGRLDKSVLGLNENNTINSITDHSSVRSICRYQSRQGKTRNEAIVAGGTYYNDPPSININEDWDAVVDYVKNGDYNNKGNLVIMYGKRTLSFRLQGHTVNFLCYKVVNNEERIYIYDNNEPYIEAYLYKDPDNGKIKQSPESVINRIDCVALVDVNKYFDLLTKSFDASKAFYAPAGTIDVEGAYASVMNGGDEATEMMMYEITDDRTEVKITPLVDNATFTYMDKQYSFGEIDGDTYAAFTLAESNEDEPVFEVNEGHIYEETRTEPTCTENGSITYTCTCGDTYTEAIEAKGHDYTAVTVNPTCKDQGYTTYTCECGDSFTDDYTEVTGHCDADGDGYCDLCYDFTGQENDASEGCSHICHKTGIMGTIWKIISFLSKLFGINPVCECGMAHY